ncbi:hypothetical protein EI94DRAFT_1046580 [Lactarius quietus]|nr:hypothetical protein EI94DRAFT_1046580 [Lactarius quietus]
MRSLLRYLNKWSTFPTGYLSRALQRRAVTIHASRLHHQGQVLWFLSLILSLSCALSATLMQQWARRYQELGQRPAHFTGADVCGHIYSMGFTDLEWRTPSQQCPLSSTYPSSSSSPVSSSFSSRSRRPLRTSPRLIGVFALVYAILTVLPNIYLSCPYATPLSGYTWRISQLSVIGYLWTILKFEGQVQNALPTLWRFANQYAPGPDQLQSWRETLQKRSINVESGCPGHAKKY